jgi:hypothetical protein
MTFRKINVGLLTWNTLVYRLFVIIEQALFMWVITGEWKFSLGVSLGWNAVNTVTYWLYHYFFLRMFKVGK